MLKPRALDPARTYHLVSLAADGSTPDLGRKSGAKWMAEGLPRVFDSSFAGLLIAA